MMKKTYEVDLSNNKDTDELRIELFKTLKEIRQEKELTQSKAGERIRMSRMDYSKHESGQRYKINKFIEMARALGVCKIVLERDG